MEKRMVKCPYCGKEFNRNAEECVHIGRRYAHIKCAQEHEKNMTQEERDEQDFYKYCRAVYADDFNYVLTKKLAERYIKENGYTYSGMLKTLKWAYEVERLDIDKANGSIGIMPYLYNRARDYFYSLYLAQLANAEKDVKRYIPKIVEVTIESPDTYAKPLKMFSLGEDE